MAKTVENSVSVCSDKNYVVIHGDENSCYECRGRVQFTEEQAKELLHKLPQYIREVQLYCLNDKKLKAAELRQEIAKLNAEIAELEAS